MSFLRWVKSIFCGAPSRQTAVPMRDLHLWIPSYRDARLCHVCGKLSSAPEHLRLDCVLTRADVHRQFLTIGSLGALADVIFDIDEEAAVYTDRRFLAVVFVQLTTTEPALIQKMKRSIWSAKSIGVLVVFVGMGEVTCTLEEEAEWLTTAAKWPTTSTSHVQRP